MNGLVAENSLIKQAEQKIEQGLKSGVHDPYMKIVISGMKVLLKDGPDGLMAQIKTSQDPLSDIVKGVIGLIGTLRRAAKGNMPTDAMVAAGMTLVLQGLDFADRTGVLKVGAAEIDQATQMYIETLLPLLGISQEKLARMTEQVHGVTQDPDKMQMIQRAGTASAQPPNPNPPPAAQPTPPPGV